MFKNAQHIYPIAKIVARRCAIPVALAAATVVVIIKVNRSDHELTN